MAKEQFANEPSTTLSDIGGINNSVTTLTPTSTALFPSTANFRIRIDNEYMKVTGIALGVWTVARGDGGTSAVSHAQGSNIYGIVTKEALDSILTIAQSGSDVGQRRRLNFIGPTVADNGGTDSADITVTGGFVKDVTASKPSAATGSGKLFLPTDGPAVEYSDGSTWFQYGPIFPFTRPPLAASWTGVGISGSTTLTDSNAGVYLTTPSSTGTYRFAEINYPTAPWTITACFVHSCGLTNNARIPALIMYDGTKVQSFGLASDTAVMNLNVSNFTTVTAFSTNPLLNRFSWTGPLIWLRMQDDNTNRNYYYSVDGVNWILAYTIGRTNFLTPTKVGWGLYDQGGLPLGLTLLSWLQTSP